MIEKREVCGTCRFHVRDEDGYWVCSNPDSDNYSDWTDYMDDCEEHDGR